MLKRSLERKGNMELESNLTEVPDTYPPALAKAVNDPFDYALMLTNGLMYEFSDAVVIDKDWVRIHTKQETMTRRFCFDRGLEIQIKNIMWVADAPHGS